MKKQAKGFPYREAKKPKTKSPEDKRPHLTQRRVWWKSDEQPIQREERAFYVPNIKVKSQNGKTGFRWDDHHKMEVWTVSEAHTLIDMWAQVSWGRYSAEHKAMSRKVRYFRKLWVKQRGRCAITGIELHGAPGCIGYGIGIDIIDHNQGVRKGNLRLVSAPIAITRLKYPEFRTQNIDPIDPKYYRKWPIFYAVLKHYQWWLQKEKPFKNLPVTVKFPAPSVQNQESWPKPQSWVEFFWDYYYPPGDNMSAWEDLSHSNQKFASIVFKNDVIYIEILKEKHPRRSWEADQVIHDHMLRLCDPNIDFNEHMTKWAVKGFESFHRSLASLND